MIISVLGPTWPFRGGISHYNTLLCENLRERHEVHLFCFKRQYPQWLFPGRAELDPSGPRPGVPGVPTLDPMNPLSWLTTARKIVAAEPDLLILHWWVTFWAPPFAVVAGLARRRGVPVLYLVHNVLPHEEKGWDRFLARAALLQGDRYIAMSEGEQQRLERLLPGSRVDWVPMPDCSALTASGPVWARDKARGELGLGETQLVALFFGFVRPYKGLRFLLEATAEIRERIDIHTLIVGEFWEPKEDYLRLVDRLGITEMVTIVDRYIPNEELGLYYAAADVVVLPYTDVTQSAVVRMAYAYDRPVITTSVGELTEVVWHGETGLIVPPRDSHALAEALVAFGGDLRTRDWSTAIARAREPLSWRNLIRAIEVPSSADVKGRAQKDGRVDGGLGDG